MTSNLLCVTRVRDCKLSTVSPAQHISLETMSNKNLMFNIFISGMFLSSVRTIKDKEVNVLMVGLCAGVLRRMMICLTADSCPKTMFDKTNLPQALVTPPEKIMHEKHLTQHS